MYESTKSLVKARQRISTLLLAILAGIAIVVVLGLVVIGLRLHEIQTELDQLRKAALPRLVKLAQLSQEASATSSIAPALSMGPTKSEFDTLLSRIRDKENSQRTLIGELAKLLEQPERVDALRRNADLLTTNLESLTDSVADQIAVGKRLEAYSGNFGHLLRALREGNSGASGLAAQAVFQVNNMLLDTNRARFARNRQETEASLEALTIALGALPADVQTGQGEHGASARAIADLWSASSEDILAEKSAQLSNAFQIKALAEENSLIANRLLSSASNEFWRASSELEAQVRLVNKTTRFTLLVILGVVVAFGAGNFLVWLVLRKRVFERLDRMRNSLQSYAKGRQRGLTDLRPDEIGEISGAMTHYMGVIDQRETELAEKTTVLERLSSQLAKYLSPQVYDSIFTGKQEVKVASSRKKLTIFFSDIAGFTETADRLESEELTQLLNHYLTEMSQIALRHGATVDKYVGDAILIFFGDPETQGVKEDALACVQMAMEMRGRMRELEDLWRESGIEKPLQIRMGIHTGYCTVGNFGSEDRLDYTIIGGAVNIASRLESQAVPGEILISYETFAHVNTTIACEERGEIDVRGIAYPVATYSVRASHKQLAREQRNFREHHAHLRLDLDLALMTTEDREAAAKSLTRALQLLNQQSASVHPSPSTRAATDNNVSASRQPHPDPGSKIRK